MNAVKWAIGIDIGGTNVKVGSVDASGKLTSCHSFATPRNGNHSLDIALLAEKAIKPWQNKLRERGFAGIGVGVPGILDPDRTIVKFAVNLGLMQAPLLEWLQARWGCPTALDSDVVMGALGERYYGAASGYDRFMYVSIGTGIGACLYEQDAIYRNSFGGPLNIGHTAVYPDGIDCPCGNRGCLEQYVSANGVMNRYAQFKRGVRESVVTICQHAEQGEPAARQVIKEAGKSLGIAWTNLAQIFGICPIVVGGGLSRVSAILAEAKREFLHRAGTLADAEPIVCQAASPDYAGVVGAASTILYRQAEQGKDTQL